MWCIFSASETQIIGQEFNTANCLHNFTKKNYREYVMKNIFLFSVTDDPSRCRAQNNFLLFSALKSRTTIYAQSPIHTWDIYNKILVGDLPLKHVLRIKQRLPPRVSVCLSSYVTIHRREVYRPTIAGSQAELMRPRNNIMPC